MFPLNLIPHQLKLRVLQKMHIKAWVRMKCTCTCLLRFLERHKKLFKVECFDLVLIIWFCTFDPNELRTYITRSSLGLGANGQQRVYLYNPLLQITELRFKRIIIFASDGFQKLSVIDQIQFDRIMSWCRIIPLKAECIQASLYHECIGEMILATGSSKFISEDFLYPHTEDTWVRNATIMQLRWIEAPLFFDLSYLSILARQFNSLHLRWRRRDENWNDDMTDINTLLKDISKGSISDLDRFTLEYEDDLRYEAQFYELADVPHTKLLSTSKCWVKCRQQNWPKLSKITVANINQSHSKTIAIISIGIDQFDFENRALYIHSSKEWNPEDDALFLSETVFRYEVIDLTSLYEELMMNKEKATSVIAHFLQVYYNE